MSSIYFINAVSSFLFSILLIPILRLVAFRINLVDKPNHRKVHQNSVPLVGGIAVFSATLITIMLTYIFNSSFYIYKTLILGGGIMLVMGVIDDKADLRASLKLAIQILLAHIVFSQGIKINSLFGVFGVYQLPSLWQYVLTIITITGVVNAFNLMDGIDGLAAGISLFSFISLSYLAFITEQFELMPIYLSISGALIGFLFFNFSKNKKIFMGDAGSLMLGFIIIVSSIMLVQKANQTSKITTVASNVLAILIIPVFDSLRVYSRRIKSGLSPFQADKTHLHHLALQLGLKHQFATLLILIIMLGIVTIGVITKSIVGLTLTFIFMLILFYLITSLLQFNVKINTWKSKLLRMENSTIDI